jgi:hypothetical protein
MPTLFGRDLSRAGLMRRVGRLDQVAGVRLVTLGDGLGRGVRVLEFRTGGGLAFEILVDRAFDVGRFELDAVPLSWQASPGIVAPWYVEPEEWGWFRSWGGGMMVTCGLDHTLGPGEDSAEHFDQPHVRTTQRFGLHGRVGGLPARLVGYGERWEGDACVLWAEGEVLQSMVYGEDLLLRRRIEARIGGRSVRVVDSVENLGHTPVSHMQLYHCNAGFPLVDDGGELLIPARATTTDYGVPIEGYRSIGPPVPRATEACFEHDLIAEADGSVPAAIVNRRLGIGLAVVSRRHQLPFLTVWRMLGEGMYAVALEPSTNRDAGRWDARERGELQMLDPAETRAYDLELTALRGQVELDAFAARVEALGPLPA